MHENVWQDDTLGELLSLEYGVGLPETSRSGDGFPVYGSSGAVGKHRNYLVQGPGIVVGRKGTVGAIVWSQDAFWCIDTTYYVLRKRNDNLRWLYWCLQSLPLKRLDSSTGVPGLNRNDVYRITVGVPPLPEQRRIAEILDTVDTAIQQTEALITKLKQMKAGLLHDLLTRGLDEHDQLRDPDAHPEQFKDSPLGRIPREWEISSISTDFDVTTGFTIDQHRRPVKNKRPYLRVANVQRGTIDLTDVVELEASDSEMQGRVLAQNDLLIVEGHASPNEIGRCALVPAEGVGLTFQNHLFRLRSKRLNPKFALAWLNSEWVQSYWRRLCGTSSGLNTINRTMLNAVTIPVPGAQEQESVVIVLEAQDVRIRAEATYHDKLKQLKKGLMDDLLTGRVRVNVAEEVAP